MTISNAWLCKLKYFFHRMSVLSLNFNAFSSLFLISLSALPIIGCCFDDSKVYGEMCIHVEKVPHSKYRGKVMMVIIEIEIIKKNITWEKKNIGEYKVHIKLIITNYHHTNSENWQSRGIFDRNSWKYQYKYRSLE